MMKMRVIKLLLGTAFMLGLSACGSIVDMIAPADIDPPAELQNIETQVAIEKLWGHDIGSGTDGQRLHLKPVYAAGQLYVAEASGLVKALDAQTGAVTWKIDLETPLSGGPGVGEGLVLMGTSDAEVIALDQSTGQLRWRSTVSSEVLSTPVAATGRVVARTIDGEVFGLDTLDGKEVWRYGREVPILTLRGTSSPVIVGDNVVLGMDGGKLIMLDILTGHVVWDTSISVPSGRSELERLADIDADPLAMNGYIYVATYQGDIASISEYTGALLWRRKFSSYSGMAADGRNLYASDDESSVWAINAQTGTVRWRLQAFNNRRLSDAVVVGGTLAIGDFEGYVHFISTEDGTQLGRIRVGSGPVTKGMLTAVNILFVQGDDGKLAALRVAKN
jgi:outer membrane protein assembly factor BamB